ncbi:MAG: hypothetical protein JW982_06290 [Spirochaetes bacterium]|nr:hypothetical protein [Spirochaetota bacterium]
MKKNALKIVIVMLVLSVSTSVFAWPDGEKTGLLMGVTTGFESASFDDGSESDSGTGFMVGTVLGYGINEKFLLDFKFRYWNVGIDDVTYHTWMWCADAMYFPVADNGFFLNAGAGRVLTLPDVDNAVDKSGNLVYFGIGYEIFDYIFISVDYAAGFYEDDLSSGTLTFAVSAIGY